MKTQLRHFLRVVTLLLMVTAVVGANALIPATWAKAASSNEVAASQPAAKPAALPATPCTLSAGVWTCELWAKTGVLTLPGAGVVPVWGFAESAVADAQVPGPALIVDEGGSVEVILHNLLPAMMVSDTVSLSFLGQDIAPDMTGVATGGTVTYTFTAAQPGTFLYEAGLTLNGGRQVAMGMYGALVVRSSVAGQAYADPSTSFDDEALLIFSEIDPLFNADPMNFSLDRFNPVFSMINGKVFPNTDLVGIAPGQKVLLRYVNAGLVGRSIGILGLHQTVIATDGSPFSYSHAAVAETLGAGQSLDTLVTIPATQTVGTQYPLYSSNLQLHNAGQLTAPGGPVAFGGILTFLTLTGGNPLPDVGPLASSVVVSPNPTAGLADVVLSALLDETTTGGANVVAAEFFTDTLGAEGTGIPIAITTPAVSVAVSATIPASQVGTWPAGDVTFYVRGQDGNGNWGPVGSTVLDLVLEGPVISGMLVDPAYANGTTDVLFDATADDTPTGNINVVAAEYFFDTPGANGSGTTMSLNRVEPIVALTAILTAPTVAGLSEGLHPLHVHALDALGNWGGFGTIDLTVDKTGPNASNLSVMPNPNNGTLGYSTGLFPSVRVDAIIGDPLGNGVNSPIALAEGFIDTTGANGTGFLFMATDGVFNTTLESAYAFIPLSTVRNLAQGPHTIYVHGKDVAGNWGAFFGVVLVIDKTGPGVSGVSGTPNPTYGALNMTVTATATDTPNGAAPASNIVAAEWFRGTDPGQGFANPMTAADGAFNSSSEGLTALVHVAGWPPAANVIRIRAKDAAGNWGALTDYTIRVIGFIPGFLFADGFENGNFNNWNAVVGAPVASQVAAMDGLWGMQVDLGAGVSSYVVDDTPTDESLYQARFFFNPNGASTGANGHEILVGRNTASVEIFGLQFENTGEGPEVRAWVKHAGGIAYTQWYDIQDKPELIEIRWESGSNVSFMLSINRVLVEDVKGLDTSAFSLTEVWVGAFGDLTGMSGVEYFDLFESGRLADTIVKFFLPVLVH